MKKIILATAACAAFSLFAEFPGPMPQNTAKLIIRQAVAEAKAYTDAAIKGGSSSDTAISNEVAAVKADVAELKTKVAATPTAEDVAAAAETAASAKGASTANTEAIAGLNTTVAGKLDASVAAETYQPKGDYLSTEADPTVPAWAKAEAKPKYDASEITYQNGFVSAYLAELNSKIPAVPSWAMAEVKPSYDATEIKYGNGFVAAFLDELNTTKLSVDAAASTYQVKGNYADKSDVYTKQQADTLFLTHHQDLSDYAKKSDVYGKTEIDTTVAAIEANLSTKAGKSYGYSKAESDTKFDALEAKLREALARVKILEKTSTPKEGVTGVVAASGQAVNVNDATTDVVVGGTIDTGTVSLTAKSVDIDNLSASPQYGAGVGTIGVTVDSPKVDVKDSKFTGPTQQSSNLVEVHNADTMTIKGTTFTGQTYNTLMTGQRTTSYLKELTIEDCTFDEDCKHVNVWFAGFQDEAVLTIRNCTFKTCEQFLCISDFAGKTNKLTVNLENVVIENYEHAAGDEYSGIILLDDRVCTSDTDFIASKPFANITLNITNVTAGGVKLTPSTFKIGTKDIDQMMYVYCAKAGKTYAYSAADKAMFPKIVIDGAVLTDPAN